MREKDIFSKFVKKGNFSQKEIEKLENNLFINDKQLIRKTFKLLNSEISYLDDTTKYAYIIYNCTDLLNQVSKYAEFDEDEVIVNRKRIKKARELLLTYSNQYNNTELLDAANKLDEIILNKSVNLDDLTRILTKLIDKKEDINIIKKLINTNKGVLLQEDTKLFDYIFNKSITAINNDSADVYYYIALLKVFYSSKIDKTKYLKLLNSSTLSTNEYATEIYYIIHGQRRLYNPDEVLEKYGIITDFETINVNNNQYEAYNDLVFTIDSESTLLRDDALSILKDGNKYIVGIHIADPTTIVLPNTILDFQAKNNLTCAYMKDTSTRILPNNIENALSLDKNKNNNVLSLYVVFDNNGDMKDYFIAKNYIKVHENLTYSQSDTLIDNYESIISTKLMQLYDLANILQSKNTKKYDYWNKKENDSLDKEITKHKSDKIINELMVLYNYLLANIACEEGMPYVYRTQNNVYLDNMIRKMDITLDSDTEKIIKNIYLKSKYSTIPIFHNGLNLSMYSHSSSPLRRYPDLYNQYLMHTFYFKDMNMNFDNEYHEQLVKYFNQRSTEIDLMQSEYTRSLKINKD